jgi:tRNA(His) 5'-end guanylyltransferase
MLLKMLSSSFLLLRHAGGDGMAEVRLGFSAGRRASKLVSLICSCFTGNYVRQWGEYMPRTPLQTTPTFDARAVLYPSDKSLRDYLAWRQADTHINNQV